MRLYTKGGDGGLTGLIGGRRVPKDDARVATYGQFDEFNAVIGWATAACQDADWRERLSRIQSQLFAMGAEVANPDSRNVDGPLYDAYVTLLEGWIDQACAETSELKRFVLPGGSELAARFHVARTVARRAERDAVALARHSSLAPQILVVLNRLSDLLFAWARLANHREGTSDVEWIPEERPA